MDFKLSETNRRYKCIILMNICETKKPSLSDSKEEGREKISFLLNQYSRFQNQDISRLGFIKMVGYRFSAEPDINPTKLLTCICVKLTYSAFN